MSEHWDEPNLDMQRTNMHRMLFKPFRVLGNYPEKKAWEKVLLWEKRFEKELQFDQKRYLGYYNPPHNYGSCYRGYVACLFFRSFCHEEMQNKFGLFHYPDRDFIEIDISNRQEIDKYTEERKAQQFWESRNINLDIAVHFNEYVFRDFKYSSSALCRQLYPVTFGENEAAEIVFMEKTDCYVHKCAANRIDSAVQWYVEKWCMANMHRSYYSQSRVFVTKVKNKQLLLIAYPNGEKADLRGFTDKVIIGGKYLRFTCNAMLLKRMIPKCLKKLLLKGYKLDKDRMFFEEHFKHSENINNMMKASIYYPIL